MDIGIGERLRIDEIICIDAPEDQMPDVENDDVPCSKNVKAIGAVTQEDQEVKDPELGHLFEELGL